VRDDAHRVELGPVALHDVRLVHLPPGFAPLRIAGLSMPRPAVKLLVMMSSVVSDPAQRFVHGLRPGLELWLRGLRNAAIDPPERMLSALPRMSPALARRVTRLLHHALDDARLKVEQVLLKQLLSERLARFLWPGLSG
jgi:hypothetical protein